MNVSVCLVIWSDVCLGDTKKQRPLHTADSSCYSLHDQKGAVEYQRNTEFQNLIASYFSPLSLCPPLMFFQAHLASSFCMPVSDYFYTHAR